MAHLNLGSLIVTINNDSFWIFYPSKDNIVSADSDFDMCNNYKESALSNE